MPDTETLEIDVQTSAEGNAEADEDCRAADNADGQDAQPASLELALETLTAERDEAQQELEKVKDRYLRAQADFDNTRKRLQREKQDVVRYAAFETIQSLLPVLDDIEKAIGSEDATPDVLRKGMEQIQQKMLAVFERAGLKPVDQHETFDPHLHEALARAPATEDQADHQIVEVWRTGYRFKDRLMRASWVKVAVKE